MKADVVVLGVSTDSVESHKKFCGELKLPFPLLSDEGGKVSKLYGILVAGQKGEPISGRSLFLIDKGGIVRHADSKYDLKAADDHAALLKALEGLKGKAGKEERAEAKTASPRIEGLVFGRITVDGTEHRTDVVIDRGRVRERDKRPSKGEHAKYGHTPLTPQEEIPWECKTLLIGIGMDGSLPVVEELKEEARKRGVKLILLKTPEAVKYLREHYEEGVNAILHVTC